MTIDKNFDPAAIESKWYSHWEATGAFRPKRPDAEPYTIVMPPPNVTGSLHIGHALDNTLQDILIRHARLQGKDALWVAGTDHAGIATQMVVERQMNERQQKRTDFTRDEFIDKIWEWKAESGGVITQQLRRLGASCDWENERFTMDAGFSKAVTKVFVDLYNQDLLYRDKRLVNWDPGLKTAISDLEVETREVQGKFYSLRYPLADGSGHIVVATTRPETMLADMAVAVSADDPRYTAMIGQQVRLPITGRLIPIVADEHADPELGTGAVKITPGHDFNDFEVGKRAGFKPADMLNMLDAEARVVQCGDIPDHLLGLNVADARKAVVAALDALGLVENIEDRVIQTPFGDRSGVVIEPWLTDQWYVDAATLAKPAIDAVRSGAIKIVPKSWEKTYFNWMENIQPWCVSRQLWWGHRIPVWYDENGTVFVAEYETAAQALAGDGVKLTRDEDVLDTWFSSALWPFGTLGWPDKNAPLPLAGGAGGGSIGYDDVPADMPTPNPSRKREGDFSSAPLLARHYPGDVLISGFDILFFWDARMVMQGLHFMKDAPWKTLYLHGLVRAADGSKMSKSKGNTVDPLGLIDQYGADALRFFMAAMESQGRDIKMDEERVKGYRNFATKLWNAARFAQSNGIGASHSVAAPKAELAVNRWIIGEVVQTLAKLDKAITDLRFDAMADCIYHFVWNQFCDWYLELIKPGFVDGERQEMDSESKAVAGWVLDQILVMLHPFMPFITEELWHALGERETDIIHAKWLTSIIPINTITINDGTWSIPTQERDLIEWVIGVTTAVRSARNDAGISPGLPLKAHITDSAPIIGAYLRNAKEMLARVARINVAYPEAPPEGPAVRLAIPLGTLVLSLEGAIDITAERARITKAIEAASKEAAALNGRLSNAAFVEKAKPEAVEKARSDMAEKSAEAERLKAALARLG